MSVYVKILKRSNFCRHERGSPFWKTTSLLLGGFCAQYDIENASTSSSGRQRIFLRNTSYLSSTLIIHMKFCTKIWKSPYSPENTRILRRIYKKDINLIFPDSPENPRILRRIQMFFIELFTFSSYEVSSRTLCFEEVNTICARFRD